MNSELDIFKNKISEIEIKANGFRVSNVNLESINIFITETEEHLKNLKNELKIFKSNLKVISTEIKNYSGILNGNDFQEFSSVNPSDNLLDISVKLLSIYKLNEVRDLFYNKYLSKFLPINTWSPEQIKNEFNKLSIYPKISDIYTKIPLSYKPKKIPKDRDLAIENIISRVNSTKSKYISESIRNNV